MLKESSDNHNGGLNPTPFIENFGSEISRDFLGKVTNQEGIGLPGAQVSIGNQFAETDGNGVFMIKNAIVYERFGHIKVERAGYINGSRSVVPAIGTNIVNIQLLRKEVTQTVSSGEVQEINLSNGASVSRKMYSLEDGSSYNGDVFVSVHHLDPSHESIKTDAWNVIWSRFSKQSKLVTNLRIFLLNLLEPLEKN